MSRFIFNVLKSCIKCANEKRENEVNRDRRLKGWSRVYWERGIINQTPDHTVTGNSSSICT